MKLSKHKIAAVLALLIGAMSVIAGSRVLLGISTPDYNVLQGLVIYNVAAGFLAIAVSVLIWRKHTTMMGSSLMIAAAHTIVLILLVTVFGGVTATESVKAMLFRVGIWAIIVILTLRSNQK